MPAFAFRVSLSEDAGVRSGFALTEAEMLGHMPHGHPLRSKLEGDLAPRIGSEDYADAVGDLLFALGAADEPGMPSLGQRFIARLDRDWRELFSLEQLMTAEAIANEYLRARNENRPDQTLLDELRELLVVVWTRLGIAARVHEHSPRSIAVLRAADEGG